MEYLKSLKKFKVKTSNNIQNTIESINNLVNQAEEWGSFKVHTQRNRWKRMKWTKKKANGNIWTTFKEQIAELFRHKGRLEKLKVV